MPIYEYQCADCGAVFEVMQRISAPAPDNCPECSGTNLKKLISKVGFQLKGTGWYETDFKNSDKKKPAESKDKKSGGDSTSDSASSSDTKEKSSGASTPSSTKASSSKSSSGKSGSSASDSA